MTNSVSVQASEFLYSMLLGSGLGVLFDIVRIAICYMPKKKILTVVSDILFWICAIIALITFVLTVSDGEMRWYVLFGVFAGAFVYGASLSKIVFRILHSAVLILKRVLGMVTYPLYLLLRFIWREMKTTYRAVRKRIRKCEGRRNPDKRKAGKNGNKKKKEKQFIF